MKPLLALAMLLSLTACALAVGQNELLPGARLVAKEMRTPDQIEIYRQGEWPRRMGLIKIAMVAAHGNGYATTETLQNKLKEEAAKVGGDVVILTGSQITNDETVGTYGGGIMMATPIQRPHLYGVAMRYSPVYVGINWNREKIIDYVNANSPAEKAGIKAGDKLVAVNGEYLRDDLIVEKEILSKKPGDKIILEYIRDGKKLSAEMVLEAYKDKSQ
jgi:membrane-associated protease RseP (regulator of RpoE activity)